MAGLASTSSPDDETTDTPPAPARAAPESVALPERNARKAPPAGRIALAVYLVCTAVFAIFAGDRLLTHSPDNHFAYLADAYLHGTLAVRCSPEETRRNTCPPGGGGNDWAQYDGHWFVAFPSLPAVIYMPAVAMFGRDFRNRAFDVALAGIAPALLYLLLERLSREGRSPRSWRENVGFSALFAFGTVYFFSAVQGSVWFTAHIVAAALTVGYVAFALDARRPFLAGVLLGLAIHARADLLWASPFFAIEALRVHRRADAKPPATSGLRGWLEGLRATDWPKALRSLVLFGVPFAAALGLSLWLNKVRFGDWGEVGYRYLQIRWHDRIERWGLFNYHYLSRNLSIVLGSLPWISAHLPFMTISEHGLALWFTSPHYLELARLRRRTGDTYLPFLACSALSVGLSLLLYQNSGWVQFGYRFSNDIAVFLILLLAINGRKIGKLWLVTLAAAIAINAFGALTFDRQFRRMENGHAVTFGFYDNDGSQQRYFQPD